jgi:hypothetical protein
MSNDWQVHEIKKPIDFSNMTLADFEEWARQGLAVPIFQEQDVPTEEEIPIEDADLFFEDEEPEEDEGIIVEED